MKRENERIKTMRQGENGDSDKLIDLYYPEILRYCLWHTGSRAAAEDAAQDTFLKAIRHMDSFSGGSFRAFLYKLAANTCIDMRRRRSSTELQIGELPFEPAYLQEDFDLIGSDDAFARMVSSLPENMREPVLLRFGQDLSLKETAAVLGLPMRTVQSRLRAALKRLKASIAREEEYGR